MSNQLKHNRLPHPGTDPPVPDDGLREAAVRARWRSRAWALARAGRWKQTVVLQRALIAVSTDPWGRESLGDRFRLLRWELALGHWREVLEEVEMIYLGLARRGVAAGPAAGWIFLARAIAHFQLGWGARFRKSLAAVLWSSRRGRSRTLAAASLEVALAYERLRSSTDRSVDHLLRRRLRRSRGSQSGELSEPDGEGPGIGTGTASRLLAALESPEGFHRLSRRAAAGSWRSLPELLIGPPELARLGAGLGPPADPRDRGTSAPPGAEPPFSRPGEALLAAWLRRAEESPTQTCPPWLAPMVANLIERESATAEPALRVRWHRALANLSSRLVEPYFRATALIALAELSLWCIAGERSGDDRDAAYLSQARADLGLAAGLLRRLGLDERADRCEERWAHLARLGLGVETGVQAGSPKAPEALAPPGRDLPARRALAARSAGREGPRVSLAAVRRRCAAAGFLTADPRMLRELAPLLLLAQSPLPVLIGGESGTGKEVIARAIHRWSGLRGEFVPIHCGAIPRDLLESELFGHTRGAFTGAAGEKAGLVEVADGGTLFLDEIGEMGMEAQMKMLRVLESGEVRRVGDLRPRTVRVRVVAATHRNLDEAVGSGRFRLDLLHRIRGITVELFPLRERRADILDLTRHFLVQADPGADPIPVPDTTLARLVAHDWPGNARELRSTLFRSSFLARALGRSALDPELLGLPPGEDDESGATDLLPASLPGDRLGEGISPELVATSGLDVVLEDLERRLILQALEENGWNRTRAALRLGGVSRTTLISKMKRLGISPVERPAREAAG